MSTSDRRQLVQQSTTINGVDYVEVVTPSPGEVADRLRLTFVNPLATLPAADQVRVTGGERIRSIVATGVAPTDDPDTVLVTLASSGDLSPYMLEIVGGATDLAPPTWIDPALNCAEFSFALDCATDLPCDDADDCPPAAVVEPRIDYLARDWESLRAVLLDRLSVLQPDFATRNPADMRMMFIELIAELGSNTSLRQDAIATAGSLGTARDRISVRRHARLVDYAMSDGRNARTWVRFAVPDDVVITSGGPVPVVARRSRFLTGSAGAPTLIEIGSEEERSARRAGAIEFQSMHALAVIAGAHTSMRFHTWSGVRPVVPTGATAATLTGHLPLLAPGDLLVLVENRHPITGDPDDAEASRRQPVRLTGVVADNGARPLADPVTGAAITEITWHHDDALPFPLIVRTDDGADDGALALGNVVLVDHGAHRPVETIGPVPDAGRVELRLREGPVSQIAHQRAVPRLDGSVAGETFVRFDPAGSASSALTGEPSLILPDVELRDTDGDDNGTPWTPQRDLISSGSNRDFVVEVDDDGAARLRFGRHFEGAPANGKPPEAGHSFMATYRIGNGTVGNVGSGAIRSVLDGPGIAAALLEALPRSVVENPVPAVGGTDPESIEQVRQRAPFAFRRQERAVTADDYARRAERYGLPGRALVQRAVANIRWTGSWYTVVVAIDLAGGADPDEAFLDSVAAYLDDYRMAGHDLQVVAAAYAPLEVGIAVTVDASYRRDLVRAGLRDVMSNRRLPDGRLGLFHPDRLTFGGNVYLGPILAAAHAVTGVERVRATRFSRYRLPGSDARDTGRIEIGTREIARLDNDPSRPERGRFVIDRVEGGR
ncbi:MAG: uncharacterized protein JWM51_1981 [Microbacteriaceae bacterium]|nr:uncharacterized protein [Microbacteriaceae bacterium]